MVKYNECSSESEGSSQAADAGSRFRVRVCMQRVFGGGDVRARAYVSVPPRRRVRWLQRRLRRLFRLPRLRLLSRGHLLPPSEPLALLRPDDPVEVVPVDAEPDDSSAAGDVVDSVVEVRVDPVNESERSSRPVSPDDLSETKRQALFMLEQYYPERVVECAAESAADVPRARRRRVRRRKRAAPERAQSPAVSAQSTAVGAQSPAVSVQSAAVSAQSAAVGVQSAAVSARLRAHAAAPVLRDALRPRAPRVVRSLADHENASFLDTLRPVETVTE